MTDTDSATPRTALTRRRALVSAGGGFSALLAGCLSDDTTPSLVGVPVGHVLEDVDSDDWDAIESTVVAETALAAADVAVRPAEESIEFYGEFSEADLTNALEAADIDASASGIRAGVSRATRDDMRAVVAQRLADRDIETTTTEYGDRPAVGFDGSDAQRDVIRESLDPKRVDVVASYPDDFASVSSAQQRGGRPPHVPVTLTDAAAERFVETLTENGFTDEGVGACSFDPSEDEEPHPGDYCLLTRADAVVHGASLSRPLAETVRSGDFRANPSFTVQTTDMGTAAELAEVLRTGTLPTDFQFETPE